MMIVSFPVYLIIVITFYRIVKLTVHHVDSTVVRGGSAGCPDPSPNHAISSSSMGSIPTLPKGSIANGPIVTVDITLY